ncbi:hypothetical protein HOLleu_38058 [Holothuria leucospilota]|uniref:EGF-like domain-containing protein n=1 Tax=Holothuria leucospilota TaxID=206669 RepID=A0A9Q0YIV7_HOLLE|nr:hypothetical protein HOLleu_38058 [Holothuria leucospilota]
MMTFSQLCLIFILSFILGAQSQETPAPTTGSQNLTPGSPTVTPGSPTVTPGSPAVTAAVTLNGTDPDGATWWPDNVTDPTTIITETFITNLSTIAATPNDTGSPTPAAPSGSNCTLTCGANETCSNDDGPKCVCVEGYTRANESSPCEVKTCDNIDCGSQGTCIGNNTVFYNCDCNLNFSFKEGDICIDKTCENSDSCSNPEDDCEDHYLGFMCFCGKDRIPVNEETDCVAKTCNNSCKDATEHCSDDNGYNCTCVEGYSRQGDDWPCLKMTTPKSESLGTTENPATELTMTTDNSLETPEMTTEPSGVTKSTKSPKSAKPQETSRPTEPTKTGESTKSPSTPDRKDVAGGHNYTGALVGLFIFLVVTCFVFVAVYVVRRRKLRNNYGRLDEDTEGDSGWSAFSKNPIYRGDRDYQLL